MTALTASNIAAATLPQARALLRQVRARQAAVPVLGMTDAMEPRFKMLGVDRAAYRILLVMADNDCLVRLGKRRRGGRVMPDWRSRNIGRRAEE